MTHPADQSRNFNFRVEIDGSAIAGFSEVFIGETAVDVVEYREGTDPAHVRKLSGLTKYGNITLKRGITPDTTLFQWFQNVVDGKTDRRTVAIMLLDEAGTPVRRWIARNAWPVRYAAPALVATGCELAIETFELAVDRVDVDVS